MFLENLNRIVEPVEEAYIGKQPNILAMEKCIDRLRKKYYEKMDIFDLVLMKNVEHDAEWQRLKELIEDQFGFYSVTLTLFEILQTGMGSTPNACTLPLHFDPVYLAKLRANLKVDSKHIRFDKKAEFCTLICLNPKLFFSKELTSGEVLAVILHEIGHNFEVATLTASLPFHYIRALAAWSQIISSGNPVSIAFMGSILLNPGRKLVGRIYKEIQNDPTLSQLYSFMAYTMNYILFMRGMSLQNAVMYCILRPLENILPSQIFDRLANIVHYVTRLSPVDLAAAQLSYVSEKYSDSFVTLHGYGPEFARAMKKFHAAGDVFGVHEIIQSTPILGHIYGLNDWIFGHITAVLDGHPDDATRMLTQVNVLEADLKNTRLDPKTRKLINKDIVECKKALKEIKMNYDSMDRNSKAKTAYNLQTQAFLDNIVTTLFPNGDLRSEIMNLIGLGRDSIVKNLNAKKEKPDSWF